MAFSRLWTMVATPWRSSRCRRSRCVLCSRSTGRPCSVHCGSSETRRSCLLMSSSCWSIGPCRSSDAMTLAMALSVMM